MIRSSKRRQERQRLLPFLERTERLERRFKRVILLGCLALLGLLAGTPPVLDAAVPLLHSARRLVLRVSSGEPSSDEVTALWSPQRERGVAATRARFERLYRDADPPLRHLFDVAGMGPGNGLLRWANYDRTLLFSSAVFEPDDRGRSYRLRPHTRSIWLQQRGLLKGPFGMLLVPDTPAVRAAGEAAGAVVIPDSVQTTNSWGCRGPEPDTDAPVRGIVLGDSFMQGLFIGNDQTPPDCLGRELRAGLGVGVSVLNTGHFGYSPEQYYYTLLEYADRFRPHFVVVSVCPNDFGDGLAVMEGRGDWEEAKYWLEALLRFCRERDIVTILAPVPCDVRLEGKRREGFYPGLVANVCDLDSLTYCNPFDEFVDAHIRAVGAGLRQGKTYARSPLYNRHIDDGHFSALGASVWGRALARRVALLLEMRSGGRDEPSWLFARGNPAQAPLRR